MSGVPGRTALEKLGREVIARTESVFDADDEGGDRFLEVVGGGQGVGCADSEVFTYTGFVHAYQSALRDSFGGCRQPIRAAISITFILPFC